MFHVINKQFLAGLLFFSLGLFLWTPDSVSITFEPLYADAAGTGFYSRTPLTATEKTLLLAGGNNAQTLGEARRNAFEAVLNLFELWFVGNSTVRVQASFQNLESGTLATGGPGDLIYSSSNPEGPSFHIALAESILEEEINGPTEADVVIRFNERHYFDYGLSAETFRRSFGPTIFVLLAIHELFHGLGFTDSIRLDGSFQLSRKTVYDINLYSERDDELLINLSPDERSQAITSGNGLVWDGTNNGVDNYSCAQISGRKLIDANSSHTVRHVVDSEGRVRLYAPTVYEQGSSVSHLAEATLDIMKPSYGSLAYAVFSMGILADMGWRLNRDNIKDLVAVEEFLERCTIATTGEPEPRQEPEQQETRQEPEQPDQRREIKSSGGGCTIAETDNNLQTTILNLFLVLSIILLSVILRDHKRNFNKSCPAEKHFFRR